MTKKVILNKMQVEDIKELINEYKDTKDAVEAHAALMMSGFCWDEWEHLNGIHPATLDKALRYGYRVKDWDMKELDVFDDETKKELISYADKTDDKFLLSHINRKEVFLGFKRRIESNKGFNIYKKLNDIDLDVLADALGLYGAEKLDIFEYEEPIFEKYTIIEYGNNKKTEREVLRFKDTSECKHQDEKITSLEIDYELSSLHIALEKGDEEEIERCKENLRKLVEKKDK